MEAHDPTSKSITVTWKAPDYDGGCPIQGYVLEKIEKDGDRFERINQNLVPGFSFVVTGLKEDMEYQFRVRAENAAGVSEPSRSSQPIKAADPVGTKRNYKTLSKSFRGLKEVQLIYIVPSRGLDNTITSSGVFKLYHLLDPLDDFH